MSAFGGTAGIVRSVRRADRWSTTQVRHWQLSGSNVASKYSQALYWPDG